MNCSEEQHLLDRNLLRNYTCLYCQSIQFNASLLRKVLNYNFLKAPNFKMPFFIILWTRVEEHFISQILNPEFCPTLNYY